MNSERGHSCTIQGRATTPSMSLGVGVAAADERALAAVDGVTRLWNRFTIGRPKVSASCKTAKSESTDVWCQARISVASDGFSSELPTLSLCPVSQQGKNTLYIAS